ncbi:MAG: hypothetical protein FJ403_23460 [Verrucomicrobia bacterium]|nr:hypothetical protein [Verrucomicrobiota bacterium]
MNPRRKYCVAAAGTSLIAKLTFMARRQTQLLGPILGALFLALLVQRANGAEIYLDLAPPGPMIQVVGDKDDEWRFQVTSNFFNWASAPALGTMFSDSLPKAIPTNYLGASVQFFRAVRTEGLFDDEVLRTIRLTFTNSNWQTRLTSGRLSGLNTPCALVLDNGLTNNGVGARYKGNTSFEAGGAKKSLNLEMDFLDPEGLLMGYRTVNLNNAAGDETLMREPVYFNVMHEFAPSPKGAMAKLFINGLYWGVYSFVEQENTILVKEWFPSNDGDRWRAPNIGNPGPGGGGGFGGSASALTWLGSSIAAYQPNYQLKTDNSTNAWERLVHVIDVLNNTPSEQFRDKVEEVLAVDRWLWFLAVENVFADDDSYFNKGADYGFYYEVESGRVHPIEHDGNESFFASDVQLSPVQGINTSNRPVLYRLLRVPELKQRYLAHMRTVLQERYNPTYLIPVINRLSALTMADIITDPKKNFTMTAYTNDLNALKSFVTSRHRFLTNHAELRSVPPRITTVSVPAPAPMAGEIPLITAKVEANADEGIDSVWLYWRGKSYGRFAATQMFDDGTHYDGLPEDGVYGAAITKYPAGTKVRYYVEARSGNVAKAAAFSPARAEQVTLSFRVRASEVSDTPIVINELMADNTKTLADPQEQFDDWIELHNVSDEEVDLTGHYLSDNPDNPRKWQFPDGTKIAAGAYLIVWADENGMDTPGLHANFKLSNNGEQVLLVDTDARLNGLLDSVTFGSQKADESYGRKAADPRFFRSMPPTPGVANN